MNPAIPNPAIPRARPLGLAGAALAMVLAAGSAAAEADFRSWLESLWPQAQRLGVKRATFEAATRGLEPDLSLPDLVVPGRPERPAAEQPEFVQTPAAYLAESAIARLAEQGRRLAAAHGATLAAVERRFGVPGPIVLAVWGRETAYGHAKLPHQAVRVLATQAYFGRRKEQFRQEFLLALKMLEEGHVALADMRSSWAGAMGQPQLLPSGFYRYAVDFDGDGRRDIWRSVPDTLATIGNHLQALGWRRGERWAYEVRVPKDVDCTIAEPGVKMPVAAWLRRGFVPAHGRPVARADQAAQASLLLPSGLYGPGFLALPNYFALKEYNVSDLYVLFVGHLADRLTDPRPFETPWAKVTQPRTAEIEAMQRHLAALGLYHERIDGKAGMKTRAALGLYQKTHGLAVDCWPSAALLAHMERRAAPQ